MKVVRVVSIVLITVALILVSSHAGGEEVLRLVPTDYSYLPLGGRNVWTYVCNDGVTDRYCDVRIMGSTPSFAGEVCVVQNYLFGLSSGSTMALCEVDGTLAQFHGGMFYTFYPWRDWDRPFVLPAIEDDCIHGSVGVFEPANSVDVPAGHFTDAITVRYVETPCACGGPAYEIFAPGVGLIERSVVTIAGVRTWSLVYANVGGRIYGSPHHTTMYSSTSVGRESRPVQPVEPATWSSIKDHFR